MSMHQRGFLDFSAPRPDLRPFVEDDSAISWQGISLQPSTLDRESGGCAGSDLVSFKVELSRSQARIVRVLAESLAGTVNPFTTSRLSLSSISEDDWSKTYAAVVDLIGTPGAAWLGIPPDKPSSQESVGEVVVFIVVMLFWVALATVTGALRPSCCNFLDSDCDYSRECSKDETGEKGYWCKGKLGMGGPSWTVNGEKVVESADGNGGHCKEDCCTVAELADGKLQPGTTLSG